MKKAKAFLVFMWFLSVAAVSAQEALGDPLEVFLDQFALVVGSIEDYQCRISEWSSSNGDEESRIVNFYFLRPRNMRMDIIIGTRFGDDGGRAVYLPNGKVVAKMRRIPFSRVLDVTDSLVTTLRGKNLLDTDLIGIQRALETYTVTGSVTFSRDDEFAIFDVFHPDPSMTNGLDREVICFDAESLLPVSADGFISGALVQHFAFSDYVLNVGLPSEVFSVRYDPKRLEEAGIPAIVEVPVRDRDLEESRYPTD